MKKQREIEPKNLKIARVSSTEHSAWHITHSVSGLNRQLSRLRNHVPEILSSVTMLELLTAGPVVPRVEFAAVRPPASFPFNFQLERTVW